MPLNSTPTADATGISPSSLIPDLTTAAIKLSTNPELWLTVAKWVYQAVTAPKPLADLPESRHYNDKTRYDVLCRLREAVSIDRASHPLEWALDAQGCPQYKTSFHQNTLRIRAQIEKINASDYPQKSMVLGMLSQISHLFQALQVRWNFHNRLQFQDWKIYREDGFEAMFFSDLALWLSVDLPRYDVKKEETAVIVARWINYCKLVHQNVLMHRDVHIKYDDPKHRLLKIIGRLERLHKNILKACRASNFNDRIKTIELSFTDISRHLFNFFYLLLRDVNKNEFLVDDFLSSHDGQKGYIPDPNTLGLTSKLMGKWIVASLKKAGIHENDFACHEHIDIHTTAQHLVTDFEAPIHLSETGLWHFATIDHDKGIDYLQQIAALHRLFLNHCYVFKTIILSAKVNNGLGHAWLYGEDTGREMVAKLLAVISDSSNSLTQAVKTFWDEFYHKDYADYTIKKAKDNKNNCYERLSQADGEVTAMLASQATIDDAIQKIINEVNNPEHSLANLRRKVIELCYKLDEYIAVTELTVHPLPPKPKAKEPGEKPQEDDTPGPEELFLIPQPGFGQNHYAAVDASNPPRSSLALVKDIIMQAGRTVILLEKGHLVLLHAAIQLLNGTSLADYSAQLMLDCQPLTRPKKFHSALQEEMYQQFLVAYAAVVNLHWSLTFFRNIAPQKQAALIALYQRMNAVMKLLYLVKTRNAEGLEVPIQPNETEIALLDLLLYHTVMGEFQKHQFHTFALQWQPQAISFNADEEEVIGINLNGLPIDSTTFSEVLKHTAGNIEERESRMKQLEEENKALRVEVKAKDKLILSQATEITSQATEITSQATEITSQATEIMSKDSKIASQASEIASLKQQRAINQDQTERLIKQVEKLEQRMSRKSFGLFSNRTPRASTGTQFPEGTEPMSPGATST